MTWTDPPLFSRLAGLYAGRLRTAHHHTVAWIALTDRRRPTIEQAQPPM